MNRADPLTEQTALLKRLDLPEIDAANQEAVQRMIEADPVLVDFRPAREVIPDMTERTIQHAGPPVEWDRRSGAQKGGILGTIMLEGLADTPQEAERLVLNGEVEVVPNHHRGTVGSMAGIISPSLPMWVVKNRKHGNYAYCTLETPLSFGGFDKEALDILRWQRDFMQPVLGPALAGSGGIDLNPITVQALHSGDDCHQRFDVSSQMLTLELTKVMLDSSAERGAVAEVMRYLHGDRMLFLGVCMAAGKAVSDVAYNVKNSTVVTVFARNGTECGIRVSGAGDRWFTGPANLITDEGIYFSGYSHEDAGLDIGDSAITEAVGLGGCAIYAAPTHWPFFGKNPEPKARKAQEKMWAMSVTTHPMFTIPALDYQGTAMGIDIRKVVKERYEPILTTAIAPKDPVKIGRMIGAGLGRAPMSAFRDAVGAFAEMLGV
jgi:hypothetical protein